MAYETGTRGRLLADRLRVVGPDPEPGRAVAAVDRDAPPATAAVRVALVDPTLDAEAREAWAAQWRSLAERGLVTPLIDLVEDDDLGGLAVIAMGASQPVLPGALAAADQAERLGAALAGAGLELGDLRLDDLGFDEEGRLMLDTVRFPAASPLRPGDGAALLLDLIGPIVDREQPVSDAVRRPRSPRRERGRRRLLLPVIAALLLAAGVIAFLPDRSSAPASIAPAEDGEQIDEQVLLALEATVDRRPQPTRGNRPSRPGRERVTATAEIAAPVATTVVNAPAPAEPDPDALPPAAPGATGDGDGVLPPLGDDAALMPIDGAGLLPVDQGDLQPVGGADAGAGGESPAPLDAGATEDPVAPALP